MVYEYKNHLIIEHEGKWRVRLKLRDGAKEIETTNLRSGQKFITKYNASILSDEDFLKQENEKRHRLFKMTILINDPTSRNEIIFINNDNECVGKIINVAEIEKCQVN